VASFGSGHTTMTSARRMEGAFGDSPCARDAFAHGARHRSNASNITGRGVKTSLSRLAVALPIELRGGATERFELSTYGFTNSRVSGTRRRTRSSDSTERAPCNDAPVSRTGEARESDVDWGVEPLFSGGLPERACRCALESTMSPDEAGDALKWFLWELSKNGKGRRRSARAALSFVSGTDERGSTREAEALVASA
jgi:hypothetical protein